MGSNTNNLPPLPAGYEPVETTDAPPLPSGYEPLVKKKEPSSSGSLKSPSPFNWNGKPLRKPGTESANFRPEEYKKEKTAPVKTEKKEPVKSPFTTALPDDIIYTPEKLDTQQKKLYETQYRIKHGILSTAKDPELVKKVIADSQLPEVKRKLAVDYVLDMAAKDGLNISEKDLPNIGDYFYAKRKSLIEDMNKLMDEVPKIAEQSERDFDVTNYDAFIENNPALKQKFKEVETVFNYMNEAAEYSREYAKKQAVERIDATKFKNKNEYFRQIGLEVRKIDDYKGVKRKEESLSAGTENSRSKIVTDAENYNDELAGINILREDLQAKINNNEIDVTTAIPIANELHNADATIESRYPEKALNNIREYLGSQIAAYRKENDGTVMTLWNKLISAAPSKQELKRAISMARSNDKIQISPEQEQAILNAPDRVQLTSAGGHVYKSIIIEPLKAINSWTKNEIDAESANADLEQRYSDIPEYQMIQPGEIAGGVKIEDSKGNVDEKRVVRMVPNPDAGKKADVFSTAQLNNIGDTAGVIMSYTAGNRLFAGIAEKLLGSIAGARIVGYSTGLKPIRTLTAAQQSISSNVLTSTFLNYHSGKAAAKEFTSDEKTQDAYAAVSSILTGLVFSGMNPEKYFTGVSREVEQDAARTFVSEFKAGNNTLNQAGMKDWAANFIVNTAKDLKHNISLIKANELADIAIEKLMADKDAHTRDFGEVAENLPATVISFAPFAVVAGYKKTKSDAGVREAVKMAIADPVNFERDMAQLVIDRKISPFDAAQKITYIKGLVKTMAGEDMKSERVKAMDEDKQFEYAANLTKESYISAQSKTLNDKTLIDDHNKLIAGLQSDRKIMLLQNEIGNNLYRNLTEEQRQQIEVPKEFGSVKTQPVADENSSNHIPVIVNRKGEHEIIRKSFATADEAKVYGADRLKKRYFDEYISTKKEPDTELSEPIEGLDAQGVPVNISSPKSQNNGEGQKEGREVLKAEPVSPEKSQPGEAVTSPAVDKPIYQDKNGNTVVTDAAGLKNVVNKNGKEVSAPTRRKVLAEHLAEYDFTTGDKAPEPTTVIEKDADYFDHVSKTSNNPQELAEVYLKNHEAEKLSNEEYAIANFGIGKITEESYNRFADRNNKNNSKARTYFNKTGQTIDQVAKEISDHYGVEISPNDIVDFIDRFPSGGDMLSDKPNDIALKALERFQQLTGFKLDSKMAEYVLSQTTEVPKELADMQISNDIALQIIKDNGLTQENLELFKHLFEGFPYDKADYDNIKQSFDEKGKTEPAAEPTTAAAGQYGTGEGNSSQTGSEPAKEKTGEAVNKEITEADIKALSAEHDKALKVLSKAEEKLSQENATQTDAFGETVQQKNLFGANRDDAKTILDPLRNKVKETKAALDAAKNEYANQQQRLEPELFENTGDSNTDSASEKHYEVFAGSRPKKGQSRLPIEPIFNNKQKDLSKILHTFAKSVKQNIFYGKVRRGAGGFYRPSDAGIVLKYSGDLDTTAHEFGHKADDIFNITGEAQSNPAAMKELKYFSNSPAASRPPKGYSNPKRYNLQEGVAEFIRAYIVAPAATKVKAPELYKIYETKVDAKTKNAIEQLSIDVREFAGSGGINITLSNIQYKPEDAKGLLKTVFGDGKNTGKFIVSFADRIAANYLQPLQVFNKAFRYAQGLNGITDVLPQKDAVVLSRLFLGVEGKIDEILLHGLTNSKGEVLKDANGNVKNIDWLLSSFDNTDMASIQRDLQTTMAYMVSERVVELSERFGKANALSGAGGGIYNDLNVALRTLNDIEAGNPEMVKRIKEAAEKYREYSNDVLQYMVDKGRMSQEQLNLVKQLNLQYVAMHRVIESKPNEPVEVFTARSGKSLGSAAKLDYAIKGSTRKIVNPYVSLVDTMHKSIKEADRNEVMQAFRDMLLNKRGMSQGEVKDFSDIARFGKKGDAYGIDIFINGKPETWVFQPDVYKAIKNLQGDAYNLPGILKMPGQVLRFTVTHFPTFAARNFIRDTQDRIIKSTTGSGLKQLYGNKQHWRDIARAGGLNAGFYFKDKAHYYGLLETHMEEMAKNKKFILADPVRLKEVWHKYENLLYKSETSNRVAEYRSAVQEAKKKGMDDYNAALYGAYKARDLIDFAVAGHHMRIINQLIPFSNAAVQGLRSSAVSLASNPAGFAMRTALYSLLPTAILWKLNHMDDETSEEYENLPAYQRDLYWNFKIGDNKWLALPKPYELSLTGAGLDRALSKVFNKNENAFDGYGGTVAKSLMPFDEASIFGVFRPIVEGITNKDVFRDKTIIPANEEKLALALRHTESASRLGQLVQRVAGIDARKADHFFRAQFSYVGNLAIKLSDIGREGTRNDFDLTDTGVFKNSPAYNSAAVQDLVKFAAKYNLEQNKDYKEFSKQAGAFFELKTDSEKDAAGKQLIDHAKTLMLKWQQENIADKKVEAKRLKDEGIEPTKRKKSKKRN